MAEKRRIRFMNFVQLPLLLSILVYLAFWQWPKQATDGFGRLIAFLETLQRPAERKLGNTTAAKTSVKSRNNPGTELKWTNNVALNEETIKSHQQIADEIAAASENEAKKRFCRQYQATYIDNPSETNRTAMDSACIGLVDVTVKRSTPDSP